MSSLFSLFGNGLFTTVVFIIALSIIVAIHEYGHYIVGRWCGIKADVFSLGFGKPLYQRTDKRGTVWQIAAIPLGGYVKFSGDANAASAPDPSSVENMPENDRRHTMHGAPLWARTLTVAAGPVFNFIFSFLIFICLMLFYGQVQDRLIVDKITPVPVQMDLMTGDEILSIEGQDVPDVANLGSFINDLPRKAVLSYTVLRDGDRVTVNASHPHPVLVSDVSVKSAARRAGIEVGDVITAIDGTQLPTFLDLQEAVKAKNGADMVLSVWRAGETFDVTIAALPRDLPLPDGGFETRWLIGISGGFFFSPATETLPFWDAVTTSARQVWGIITMSVSAIGHMITGAISTCNMSGAIGMAQFVGSAPTLGDYIGNIALISTAIGMLNLFPIPVLDGGHLVFYAYEAIRGKPLPDRAVNLMMMIGMAVILSIMVLGLSSDLFCK
ncbi:RIP metalloprotease RseP [Pacificibacter marinus]|uniref:Zinc metalloprotease n=1 Tax=Pacificibacter marinus TaxID=658057 RepID=A0A1Y5TLB0_9RHOB|nr:RIP metalloprotease RseP [Pacificibacter marinus]SEL25696.1 regulator of sigma E protease [Pacificibacter marinus]SLN64670.1 Regulator of sigma-E protease RseP [Pacificibacter marinus]